MSEQNVAALNIRDLNKIYDGGFEAIKSISLAVEPGDFYALLGPNGAGKSTTIGIICSLVEKTSGLVEVFGHNIDTEFSQAKTKLGIVPQEFNFNQFETALDIVVNQAGYYGIPRGTALLSAEKYLKQLGLWDKRNEPSRHLSGGMKRRLMIARALVHEPELLILDEPTAGVDIELRRSMWTFLRELNAQGRTIILTTHYLEEAESLCRNVGIIDQGRIIKHCSMSELLAELQQETYILDLAEAVSVAPSDAEFDFELRDNKTLEVTIDKTQSLNAVFNCLSAQSINVSSLRNKSNRLEELFVKLMTDNKDVEAQR